MPYEYFYQEAEAKTDKPYILPHHFLSCWYHEAYSPMPIRDPKRNEFSRPNRVIQPANYYSDLGKDEDEMVLATMSDHLFYGTYTQDVYGQGDEFKPIFEGKREDLHTSVNSAQEGDTVKLGYYNPNDNLCVSLQQLPTDITGKHCEITAALSLVQTLRAPLPEIYERHVSRDAQIVFIIANLVNYVNNLSDKELKKVEVNNPSNAELLRIAKQLNATFSYERAHLNLEGKKLISQHTFYPLETEYYLLTLELDMKVLLDNFGKFNELSISDLKFIMPKPKLPYVITTNTKAIYELATEYGDTIPYNPSYVKAVTADAVQKLETFRDIMQKKISEAQEQIEEIKQRLSSGEAPKAEYKRPPERTSTRGEG